MNTRFRRIVSSESSQSTSETLSCSQRRVPRTQLELPELSLAMDPPSTPRCARYVPRPVRPHSAPRRSYFGETKTERWREARARPDGEGGFGFARTGDQVLYIEAPLKRDPPISEHTRHTFSQILLLNHWRAATRWPCMLRMVRSTDHDGRCFSTSPP